MMKPSLAKRTRLLSLGASLLCLFATVGCEVNVEEPGEMPDVDVRGEAGEMPEVDFQGPEVEAEMESSEVQVPDVDVETETQELQVPDIDVSVPGETKNE